MTVKLTLNALRDTTGDQQFPRTNNSSKEVCSSPPHKQADLSVERSGPMEVNPGHCLGQRQRQGEERAGHL